MNRENGKFYLLFIDSAHLSPTMKTKAQYKVRNWNANVTLRSPNEKPSSVIPPRSNAKIQQDANSNPLLRNSLLHT
ncbi:hypothetical protein LC653_46110 [Nostoc sp. CHAB 5784]|uniref:hypothetical protein n=1 Tax=Nostoc mirabile TaxID=2907820 RepID=UPI001E36A53B|nr:hypothetical protein [Nostoc mirabile]MCC5670927.1 hypothetical protein [Nostoc mirabile CHAB5784]